MGTTAPVGTLIVSQPKDNYKEGDIVSYYSSSRIYTHRIVGVDKDGNYITKGDLNATNDALPLAKHNIIGSAVFVGKYIGWIWRALPILTIGMVIAYLISISKRVKDDWRWPVRIIGYCISVIIATFILNPWIRVQLTGGYMPIKNGVEMPIVNTGIFPIKDEKGGRFFAGEVRTVKVHEIDEHGRFVYIPRPSLGFWGVVLLLLWCLLPLIFAMTVKLPLTEEQEKLKTEEFEKEKRISGVIFAFVLVASILFLVFQLSTLAAFTGRITNSTNTATTRSLFRCGWAGEAVNRSYATQARLVFSYDLTTNAQRNHTNILNGATDGIKKGTFSTSPSTGACDRDARKTALNFNGRDTCVSRNVQINRPAGNRIDGRNNFTIEAWFKTSSRNPGKIMGFGGGSRDGGDERFENDFYYDRHIYVGNDGRLVFGAYPGRLEMVYAEGNYADNQWHHVVATMSSTTGMKLYVDGRLAGTNPNGRSGQDYEGYWKIGCGGINYWPHTTGVGSKFFQGSIRNASLYVGELSEEQVKAHYLAGK